MRKLTLITSISIILGSMLYGSINESAGKTMPVSTTSSTQHGDTTEGLQLSASLATTQISAGLPIYLDLVVKNVSNAPIDIREISPEMDYIVDIFDLNEGGPVQWTRFGERVQDPRMPHLRLHSEFLTLAPGGTAEYRLQLDRMYDLSLPGDYSLDAHFEISKEGAKDDERYKRDIRLISNTVVFQIKESDSGAVRINPPE